MPDFDAKKYVALVDASKTVDSVDAAFAEIEKLGPAEKMAAVDAVEKAFVDYTRNGAPPPAEMAETRMLLALMDKGRDTLQGQFLIASLEKTMGPVEEGLALSQVFLNIHKIKGEAADPTVRFWVAEAAKLSDDDYASSLGQMKILVNVTDKVLDMQKPARKNPFRAGPDISG